MKYKGKLYGTTDGKKFVEMLMTGQDVSKLDSLVASQSMSIEALKDQKAVLVQALKIIVDGDPISIGLDEVEDISRNALEYCGVDCE